MDDASNPSPCSNSFLQETDYNSDISSEIRRNIDTKFYNSKINSSYAFPRIQPKPKLKPIRKKRFPQPKPHSLIRQSSNMPRLLPAPFRLPLSHLKSLPQNPRPSNFKPQHRRYLSDQSFLSLKLKNSPYLSSITSTHKSILLKPSLF
jgi:hypothetical protein